MASDLQSASRRFGSWLIHFHGMTQGKFSHTLPLFTKQCNLVPAQALELNRHFTRHTGPVSVDWDLQLRLVSGWGLQKRRSAPPYHGPSWLAKHFGFFMENVDVTSISTVYNTSSVNHSISQIVLLTCGQKVLSESQFSLIHGWTERGEDNGETQNKTVDQYGILEGSPVQLLCYLRQLCVVPLTLTTLKVGFHYPSSRPELTGVKKCTRVLGPSTRPVNSGRELG